MQVRIYTPNKATPCCMTSKLSKDNTNNLINQMLQSANMEWFQQEF